MRYAILGPKTIHRDEHGSVLGRQKALWDDFDNQREGVSDGCGCYVFAVRAGRGYKPWYVGKAAKQNFRQECFTAHKLAIYRSLMFRYRAGTPVLFLAVRETPTGRLSNPSERGRRDVDFLETMLIGQALRANIELCNVKDTKLLKDITVPGLINGPKGMPSQPVLAFKRLLNL